MKRILFVGLTAMCLGNMAYADFTFYSNTSNSCEYISGRWTGKGRASNWLLGECVYHGSGTVSAIDGRGNFTVDVSADKDSGNLLCPNHASKQLVGVCVNGAVTIKTEYGNLKGNFTANSGDAKGTLSVSPGVEADVSVHFVRSGK